MLSVDNVNARVIQKLRETAEERRLWIMEGIFPQYTRSDVLDRYCHRIEKALRREVVARARELLPELPELEALLLRADHGRRGLLVSRTGVTLVFGYPTGGQTCLYASRKFTGSVPEEVLQ